MMPTSAPVPADLFWNERTSATPSPAREGWDPIAFHRRLPGYAPTPVETLTELAASLGIGRLSAKLESTRLGLPAFKILGASWAIYRELCRRLPGMEDRWESLDDLRREVATLGPLTFVAATDGNHGRAVAHMARLLGCDAHVLVPDGMVHARIAAIEREGATVEVVDGSYDDAIARSARMADDRHLVISDTAWPGYDEVPRDVIDGYRTIFAELGDQRLPAPSHAFIQMGVGALATAAIVAAESWPGCRVVGVEPDDAACILASLRAGDLVETPGPHRSIMAGLNCGLPSPIAWPYIQAGIDLALAATDDAAREAMRVLASAGIVAGETGAAGLAGLLSLAAMDDWPATRQRLGLDETSHVLVVITEGATDPAAWESITGRVLGASAGRH
jgi:diaminopropionate ammonia-lyase